MPTVIRFQKGRYLSSGIDLSDLFEQLPEPIAYFDSENRLGACNRSFRNHFPVVIESEFLRRISKSPAPGYRRSARAPERPALAGPGTANLPAPPIDLEPQLSKTADGGTLLTLRDSSALRRMEETYLRQIDEMKEELAAANQSRLDALNTARARKDFLTSTSHELRTPLNAILGFSEMLTKEMFGPLPNERYRQYAQIIHDSGAHVLS